jgi:Na+(H+)/acetate symporter ActP
MLMRFFTVRDARSARKSALFAMLAIGVCHLLIVVIGFSAALNVGQKAILAVDKGGNLAAPRLAQFLGGGPESFLGNFMLAFVAAVSFATIVAVVAGLTLAAAASLAHDVYVGAIRNGQATEKEQMTAACQRHSGIDTVSVGIGTSDLIHRVVVLLRFRPHSVGGVLLCCSRSLHNQSGPPLVA